MNSNHNGGFNPNQNRGGFNPRQQYNDNQENNNPESNHGQNFTDRLGKITDLINDVADGRRSRNNQQQNNNYYNDQPLNNVFADDPNEELAKKAFTFGLFSLILSVAGVIVFWVIVILISAKAGAVISALFNIGGIALGIMGIIRSSKYNKLCRNRETVNSVNKKKNQTALVLAIVGIVFCVFSFFGGCLSCMACNALSALK